MLNKLFSLVVALLLAWPAFASGVQLPASGQKDCFDASGNARACTGSGEDGELQSGAVWPIPRFSDSGNGTLTDNLTGLVWSKDANAPGSCSGAGQAMTWQAALDFITCLNAGAFLGFTDWRLPNLNELESLVNAGGANASAFLNASGFTQVQSGLYWSSSSDSSDKNAVPPSEINAWDVDFATGGLSLSSLKSSPRSVWPVRGSSAAPAPAQLWQTGQTKCFDAAGQRINPCTGTTGQDGELLAGAAWPIPRFQTKPGVDVSVDLLTNLAWPRNSKTPGPALCPGSGQQLSWQEALDQVKCLNQRAYLGITSWRLPNRKELRSLADYGAGNPALTDTATFNSESGLGNSFWSSTSAEAAPKMAWSVNLFDGSVNPADKRNGLLLAWPVTNADSTPPALTLDPLPAFFGTADLTVSGSVETGVTPAVSVSPGGNVAPVTISGTTWSAKISGLGVGTNTIFVNATDPFGNISKTSASLTVIKADGSFSGGAVTIADALKALRFAVGIVTPTAAERIHGDVAPPGAPDDRIDVSDALLILKKAVGLVSF